MGPEQVREQPPFVCGPNASLMIPFGKVAAVLAVFIVVLSGLAMLTELELVSYNPGGARRWRPSHEFTRGDYGTDIMINPGARLPNERSRKGEWLTVGDGQGCWCGGAGGIRCCLLYTSDAADE